MPFYSELFDTGLLAPAESAAAKSVLMLRVLHDRPVELTTSHSFSSQLIEECATDENFRKLVREKRIRFKVRPDGTTPKQAFIAALSDPQYRFENWRELLPDPKTGSVSESASKRRHIIDVLTGKCAWTGDTRIDDRLMTLKQLFEAIEWSKCVERELPRAGLFTKEMLTAYQHVPDEYPDVREFVRKLGAMQLGSRSAAYNAIDQETSSLADVAVETRGVVDSVLNKTLAQSLGQQLLSIERRIPLLGTFNGTGNAGYASVIVENVDIPDTSTRDVQADARLRKFTAMEVKWKEIALALDGLNERVHPDDAKAARRKLAKALAERRFLVSNAAISAVVGKLIPKTFDAVPVALTAASALGSAAGAWYIPHFDGALGQFAHMLGSSQSFVFGAGLGGLVAGAAASTRLKDAVSKAQTNRIEQVINGWLDDCQNMTVRQ